MRFTSRFVYLVPALLLAACGDDGGQTAQKSAAPAEPAASAPMQPAKEMAAAPAAGEAMGTIYVDHARDEIEFSLKKSKAGLEALVEDYDAAGIDSGPLKEQIVTINTELDSL
jgi:hypothetical protein